MTKNQELIWAKMRSRSDFFASACKFTYMIMLIKEIDYIYKKDQLQINIKDIQNGDKLIEIEENEQLDTIDKIKEELEKLNIPIYTNDYFIKKAEIDLKKIL